QSTDQAIMVDKIHHQSLGRMDKDEMVEHLLFTFIALVRTNNIASYIEGLCVFIPMHSPGSINPHRQVVLLCIDEGFSHSILWTIHSNNPVIIHTLTSLSRRAPHRESPCWLSDRLVVHPQSPCIPLIPLQINE